MAGAHAWTEHEPPWSLRIVKHVLWTEIVSLQSGVNGQERRMRSIVTRTHRVKRGQDTSLVSVLVMGDHVLIYRRRGLETIPWSASTGEISDQ